MLVLNSYGANILRNFIQKCIECIGEDYSEKILIDRLAPAELNSVINTDEDLAAWFIYNNKDKPAEISTKIHHWAKDNFLEVISLSLYIDGYSIADCHEVRVYDLLKIIGKAYSRADDPKMLEISKDKKSNLAYWDEIDNLSEKYVKELSSCGFNGDKLDEMSDIIDLGKKITEFATELLRTEYGYSFPYVEGDY